MNPPRHALPAATIAALLFVSSPLLASDQHSGASRKAATHTTADHPAAHHPAATHRQTAAPARATATQTGKQPDIRVLIDISGSMKKTDPENLRKPAVKLLSQLLPENSRAGMWVFGENVRVLVPEGTVNAAWRKQALARMTAIDSSGLFTHIGAALDTAGSDLAAGSNGHTAVILLTDGMVDISKTPGNNEQERKRVLSDVLQHYHDAGVPIHTIALSDEVDTELLQQLSLRSDGLALTAATPEDLLKIFNRLLKQEASPDQLPLDNNRFKVDSSIEEFTLLVFHPPGSASTVLDTPQQQHWNAKTVDNNLNWYADSHYDLITVKKPAPGEWHVQAPRSPDNQVTIISNLQVNLDTLPNNYDTGSSAALDVHMTQKGEALTDNRFLDLLTVDADITQVENRQGWKTGLEQDKGHYRKTLQPFTETGTYRLTILVDGKTFERKLEREIHVSAPPVKPVEPVAPAAPAPHEPVPAPAAAEEHKKAEEPKPEEHKVEPAKAEERKPDEHKSEEHKSEEHKPEAGKPAEHKETPAGKKTPWWVYVAIVLGNLLLLGLGYFGYRMLFKKPGGEVTEDAEAENGKTAGKKTGEKKDKD